MELVKRDVKLLRNKSGAISQVTFDEDVNVADTKPDVGRMIQKKGEIGIDELSVGMGQAELKGRLRFYLLYGCDGNENRIDSLQGELMFDETIQLQGLESGDKISLRWEIEDLSLQIINSRKLNIRALVSFEVSVEEETVIVIPEGQTDGREIAEKKKELHLLQIDTNKKDTLRLKQEFSLPSNKPNIHEILWDDIDVRGLEIRAGDEKLIIKGELFGFVLYRGEDETQPLQWVEQAASFVKEIESLGCKPDEIPDVGTMLSQAEVSVKPDADGEERILQTEVLLELEIRLYRQESCQLLQDIYTPGIRLIPEMKEQVIEQLLIKNCSKCRVNDRISLGEEGRKILQICHSGGTVKLDDTKIVENGIEVEGVITVRVLYIIGDDDRPFYAGETVLPFSHRIEAEGIDRYCRYRLHAGLEQLSTSMADSDEIEVKAVLNLNALVLRNVTEQIMTEVREEEIESSQLEKLPGIICYQVQSGDTLWNLAREFYTTMDEIRELNQLGEAELTEGESLIIVKHPDGYEENKGLQTKK